MKKKNIKIFFVIVLLFVSTIGIVFALEYKIDFKWSTDPLEQLDPRAVDNSKNSVFNDGVLIADTSGLAFYFDYGNTTLSYRDSEGKELASAKYEYVVRIVNDKKYVYLFLIVSDSESADYEFVIRVLNDKLEVVKDIPITHELWDASAYYYSAVLEQAGFETISNVDGKTYIHNSTGIIYVDVEKGTYELLERNDENLQKYFPIIYLKEKEEKANVYISYDKEESIVAKAGSEYNEETKKNYATMRVEENGTKLFEIVSDKYTKFSDIKIISDYIIFIASYQAGEGTASDKSDILVYDKQGNLLAELAKNSKFNALTEIESGFIVSRYYAEETCEFINGGDVEYWIGDSCKTHLTHEKYLLSVTNEIFDSENPDTASLSVICLGVVGLLAVLIIHKSKKNMKQIS